MSKVFGFFTLPSTLTVQGRVGSTPAFLAGSLFLHAELVEVVVVGDVFEAGQVFAGRGERALHGLQLGTGMRANARGSRDLGEPIGAKGGRAGGRGSRKRTAQKLLRSMYHSYPLRGVISEEGMSAGFLISMH